MPPKRSFADFAKKGDHKKWTPLQATLFLELVLWHFSQLRAVVNLKSATPHFEISPRGTCKKSTQTCLNEFTFVSWWDELLWQYQSQLQASVNCQSATPCFEIIPQGRAVFANPAENCWITIIPPLAKMCMNCSTLNPRSKWLDAMDGHARL